MLEKEYHRQRINSFLESATPEELERVSRILSKEIPVLRLKRKTGRTFLLELPVELAEKVTALVGSRSDWTDGKTDLERSIDQRLERMRK